MGRIKRFVICSRKNISSEVQEEIKRAMNIDIIFFNFFEDFQDYLVENNKTVDIIGIDVNRLNDEFKNNPDLFLLRLVELGFDANVKTVVLAEVNMDVDVLETCLDAGFNGLYPFGPYFDLNEKLKALNDVLHGKKHIPCKIRQKISSAKKKDSKKTIPTVYTLVLKKDLISRNFAQVKQVGHNLNTKFQYVQSVPELIKTLTEAENDVHAIFLDMDPDLYVDLDFFQVYDTLSAVIKCNNFLKDTLICGSLSMHTDLQFLRKVKSLITSYAVYGPEFSIEEKEYSVSCALKGIPYIHPKILEKLNPKNHLRILFG